MKNLITITALIIITGCSSVPYAKVGVGYKIDEAKITWTNKKGEKTSANEPLSARFELGLECGAWSYGISHHSQWFSGAPFNDRAEYDKTEFFVDYKWGGQ